MTRDDFNAFCAALPATTHVVQWGNSDVWKVGGKVFAICGTPDDPPAFTFKVTELAFEVLGDSPGLRPAPYLASRGLKWIQQHAAPGLSDAELRSHLRASYDMIAAALPTRKRADLGL
ncbi:MmcQ/YjbR family DNA-binding protein [Sulfitobacter sabulilitoris]|uniref:MmcQ/YjbR family DNA-binding protein n=1 Tax=Sulfitobacter sabulilitoris TaxID=2562655 RepID=A0A5S3PPE2_9RHOB|nr:MmcQ/YjbR family DNA-binding protein [Sulfitobacter sabulilitoris]TMM55460.1 MmcQ/YjbR family DNA-binding protein [Sulfitobacter sabulilitoris]